jgi:hypothetical protein
VYYNLIVRLKSWAGNLLGGHKPPPEELRAGRAAEQLAEASVA